jgi:hypothetical protein
MHLVRRVIRPGARVREPDEHDELLDVFSRGRLATAERKAELARALTRPPDVETAGDLDIDKLIDLVAQRAAQRAIELLSEPDARAESWT